MEQWQGGGGGGGGGWFKAELIDITEPIEETFGYDIRPKCSKYGEYAGIYSFNKKWLPILENAKTEGLTLGIFGEALRTLESIDIFYKSPYSMRDMIRDVYCNFGVEKKCLHSDTLYDFIEGEMQLLANGMDIENLTRDDIFRLFTYSRFEANVIIYGLLNMFTYSFPVFSQKVFADANFSIPYEWREGDYFSLSLTKKFCPKLLEVPFFSHNHRVIYDPETNRVKAEAEYTLRRDVRLKVVNTHPLLFKILRGIYRAVRFIRGGEEISKQNNEQKISRISEKMIRESPTILRSKLKPIDNMPAQYAIASIAAAIKVEDTLTDD